MTDLPTMAVTGSTGKLGGAIAEHLAARGVQQRLLVRSPAKAPVLTGATVLPFAYDASPATAAALEGVSVLLMVSAAESEDRLQQHCAFVDSAARAGVDHIVYTSFAGAGPAATFTLARDHGATEQHIRASGMRFTMLPDNLYTDFLADLVGDDGVIRGPAGDGRVASVTRADVALVAADVLVDPAAHAGRTWELTGPEALSLAEVAEVLATHTGRPVRYEDETLEAAYASRARWNAPRWQLDAWVSTYTAIAVGELARVTDDVETVTGRRPRSFIEYLEGVRPAARS